MKLTSNSRLTRDKARKHDLYIHDVTIMTSQGCNNFQLFCLGNVTRNYYTPVICYHVIGNYLIKRQSERYIIMECIELSWLCKHMKEVRSSQAAVLVLNWVKQFFPANIVKRTENEIVCFLRKELYYEPKITVVESLLIIFMISLMIFL